ncbi:MAG: hypothetical protein GWO82_05815, partial [Bacteroidetes bacterium]|nr:hypothetical protein [Bacteroidota bacterium]
KPERFEFTSCCSLGTGFAAGDDYNKTGLEVATTEAGTNPKTGNTNTTSGSNAKFDVIIHDGVLKSVSVNTRGNGYVLGNVLTVTVDSDSDSNKTVTITLDDVFLNYVNAFDENAFSAIPINEGDKLQMIFHISSHPGQQDASGDPVYISRSALIELQVYQQQQEDTTSLKQP